MDVVDDRTATEAGPVPDHAVAGAGPRSTSTRLGGASLDHTVTKAGPTLDHMVMEAGPVCSPTSPVDKDMTTDRDTISVGPFLDHGVEANGPRCISSPILLKVERSANHAVTKDGPVSDHMVMEAGPLPLPSTTTGAPPAVAPSSCASAIKAPTGARVADASSRPKDVPIYPVEADLPAEGSSLSSLRKCLRRCQGARFWVKGGSPLSSTCSPSAGSR